MLKSSPLTPNLRWNETAGRYIGSSGRFQGAARVRRELDTYLEHVGANVGALSEGLRSGRLAVADWQVALAREVKSVHVASAALARGGWAQMSPADYGRAGQKIRAQYGFLRNFAQDIASGSQRLDGTLSRRAQMYVEAGRGTYHATERVEQVKRGMVQERNVLHAADSCPGCLSADALGWVDVGTLPEIGSRDCLTKCMCSIEYRTAAEAEA